MLKYIIVKLQGLVIYQVSNKVSKIISYLTDK